MALAKIAFERVPGLDSVNRNFDKIKQLAIDLNALRSALGGRSFTVRGRVSSAGVVQSGSVGFSASRTSAGVYSITFSVPFSVIPTPSATLGATSGLKGVAITAVSVSGATVVTFNASALADGEFYFSADGIV